jgi:hypothetical protein
MAYHHDHFVSLLNIVTLLAKVNYEPLIILFYAMISCGVTSVILKWKNTDVLFYPILNDNVKYMKYRNECNL